MPGTNAYIGVWMNYDSDGVGRATLTLPVNWASYLISGLALLVSIAGSSCWAIAAYVMHQKLVRPTFDPLHLQLQVLLRNTESALVAMKELAMIQHAWPRHENSKRPVVRVLPIALVAFVVASFAVASVFVAAIASRSEQDIVTLVKPGAVCGWVLPPDISSGNEATIAVFGGAANSSLRARGYAKDWYARDNGFGTPPSVFPIRTLPYTVGTGPCPFPDVGRCISNDSSSLNSAIVLDTGLLDSHAHFGVNLPKENRIRSRMVTTCAPLNVSEFIHKVVEIDEETYYDLSVGSFQKPTRNITFRMNAHSTKDFIGYQIRSATYNPDVQEGGSSWIPIPPFKRADALVSIYAVAQNSITYLSPVYDPLFIANEDYVMKLGNTTYYRPKNFFNIIGCIDQYQFCNPNNMGCTAATSLMKAYSQGRDILDLNTPQVAVLTRTSLAFAGCSSFSSGFGNLGVGGLQANEITFNDFISPPLPPNQWEKEVLLWFQTGLSYVQQEMFSFVDQPRPNTTGLDVHSVADMDAGPLREAMWNMCVNQKTSSAGQVQNFNFVGLMIIICLSVFIITLALILEPCVRLFRMWRETESGRLRQRSWEMDSKYDLVRKALQGQGVRPWRKGGRKKDSGIPVIHGEQILQLSILDQDDLLPLYQQKEIACTT
ncbi:hypothetical protein B0O99DRAFT_711884 [Bisporella sp. PMI_857]|nr:hypothetical protein B0O99DRAFT_711884 [Bisporella sp. PMI_857]